MKKKPLSEHSLDELQEKKESLKLAMIGIAIGWILVFIIMVLIPKYNLLTTFIPLAMVTFIPIYASIDEIKSEIRKRQEK